MNLSPELDKAVADCGALLKFRYPWWLRPFLIREVVGITLGRRIYVSSSVGGAGLERLLRHEIEHVRQINKNGVARFYIRYITEFARNFLGGMTAQEAYRNVSFELEACAAEEVCGCADV